MNVFCDFITSTTCCPMRTLAGRSRSISCREEGGGGDGKL